MVAGIIFRYGAVLWWSLTLFRVGGQWLCLVVPGGGGQWWLMVVTRDGGCQWLPMGVDGNDQSSSE